MLHSWEGVLIIFTHFILISLFVCVGHEVMTNLQDHGMFVNCDNDY